MEENNSLPQPNIKIDLNSLPLDEICAEHLRGILCNPIYAGLGFFPAVITDALWVSAAEKFIDEDGLKQFLVNLLASLRATIGCNKSREEIKSRLEMVFAMPASNGSENDMGSVPLTISYDCGFDMGAITALGWVLGEENWPPLEPRRPTQ